MTRCTVRAQNRYENIVYQKKSVCLCEQKQSMVERGSPITLTDFMRGIGSMISFAVASMVGGYVVLQSQSKHDDEMTKKEALRDEDKQALSHYPVQISAHEVFLGKV